MKPRNVNGHTRTAVGIAILLLATGVLVLSFGQGPGAQAQPPSTLTISIADDPDPVAPGGTVKYTITVQNTGSEDETGVVVEDTLSGAGTIQSAVPTQGSCDVVTTTLVRCILGTIPANETATIQLQKQAASKPADPPLPPPGEPCPTPPAGKELDQFDGSLATIDIDMTNPSLGAGKATVLGRTCIFVDTAAQDVVGIGPSPGWQVTSGPNGQDEVGTEIVQMFLFGTAQFGALTVPVWIIESPFERSTGFIEEQQDTQPGVLDFPADSFFDVFVYVYVDTTVPPDGVPDLVMKNRKPVTMSAKINSVPPGPGEKYESKNTVELVDQDKKVLGTLTGETHVPERDPPKPPVVPAEEPCAAGSGQLIDEFNGSEAEVTVLLTNPAVGTITANLSGPTCVLRAEPPRDVVGIEDSPWRAVDGGNGLHEAQTEIVRMRLTGLTKSQINGEDVRVTVIESPTDQSIGYIEEQQNAQMPQEEPMLDCPCDSFFDVFVYIEVDIGDNGTDFVMKNIVPVQMSKQIGQVPPDPGTVYESKNVAALYDLNKKALGILIQETHTVGEIKQRNPKRPPLQNLWLTRQGDKIPPVRCEDGIDIALISHGLSGPITNPDPKDPTQVQQLAAFEFDVHYDSTKVCVNLEPGSEWQALIDSADAVCTIEDQDSPQLEGVARIGCVTVGKGHEIDDTQPLATIQVRPQPEIYSQAKPNQDNGVVVQLNNVNCDLSDEQGHPIPKRSCGNADITFRYLEGDVNPDCVVDAVDAQTIAFRWGVEKGSLIYNDFLNLEPSGAQADNDIDINDLQFVFGRMGSTCADPHPPQLPVNPKA